VAVGHLKGVGEVSADAEARALSVRYDPSNVTVESMQEALSQIGYESTVVA
jgi:copper chaperone CopZ